MITETSGVLESNFDQKSLCYFEVQDLNVEQPASLQELVQLMTQVEGIRVRYQVFCQKFNPIARLANNINIDTEIPHFNQTKPQSPKFI